MKVNLVRTSENSKLGPMPAAYVSEDTCPNTCPLRKSGCYGDGGPVRMAWNKVSAGQSGVEWTQFLDQVKALPRHTLWRYGVVGDIPHTEGVIDTAMLDGLVAANKGKRGFLFTHHDIDREENRTAIANANQQGLTINLSADSLADVDRKHALGIGPVVSILPRDAGKVTYTLGGVRIVTCPAAQNKAVTCSSCGICQKADRKTVIGFPAHGSGAKKAEAVFNGINIKVI